MGPLNSNTNQTGMSVAPPVLLALLFLDYGLLSSLLLLPPLYGSKYWWIRAMKPLRNTVTEQKERPLNCWCRFCRSRFPDKHLIAVMSLWNYQTHHFDAADVINLFNATFHGAGVGTNGQKCLHVSPCVIRLGFVWKALCVFIVVFLGFQKKEQVEIRFG